MIFKPFLPFDNAVFQFLQSNFHPGSNALLDHFWLFVTHLADKGILWFAIALLLLIPNKTRKIGVIMVAALLVDSLLVNVVLKQALHRPRPFDLGLADWMRKFVWPNLIEKPRDYSFPSGHTAISFAGAASMLLAWRKELCDAKPLRTIAIAAVVLAVLVGISRVYLGVHYATDVIAGALVGCACAVGMYFLFAPFEPVYNKLNEAFMHITAKFWPKLLR